jgi:hypothetical protein
MSSAVSVNIVGGERMAKRITLMIPDKLDKQLRNYQASVIKATGETYSFSQTVVDQLEEKGIPTKYKKLTIK